MGGADRKVWRKTDGVLKFTLWKYTDAEGAEYQTLFNFQQVTGPLHVCFSTGRKEWLRSLLYLGHGLLNGCNVWSQKRQQSLYPVGVWHHRIWGNNNWEGKYINLYKEGKGAGHISNSAYCVFESAEWISRVEIPSNIILLYV